MQWKSISKDETQFVKGVSIFLILSHNYFHWVKPKIGENEFAFNRDRILAFGEELFAQPMELLHLLFTYLGHYGVQIFIFLSAYGLYRSYHNRDIGWWRFMWKRVSKLYPVFVLAILVHFAMVVFYDHGGGAAFWYLKFYLFKLSLLSNFVPGQVFTGNGPWWFFSFIVQFYAVFPLMRDGIARYGDKALLAMAVGAYAARILVNPYFIAHDLNLYFTVLGYLPELSLGIYLARRDNWRIPAIGIWAALLVFLLSNWFGLIWQFASTAVLILMLAGFRLLLDRSDLNGIGTRFFHYLGRISLPLFAVHGVLRAPFVDSANATSDWAYTLALWPLFFVVSLVVAQFMDWLLRAGAYLYAETRQRWPVSGADSKDA